MKAGLTLAALLVLPGLGSGGALLAQEQDQTPNVMWAPGGSQDAGGQQRGQRQGRIRPVFGKISAIQNDSIEVTEPDGNKVTLKLTSGTEYRKERQPAKLADFKVGDPVIVRTDQPDGKGTTAVMVATGSFAARGSPGGPAGPGAAGGAMFGTFGKDFVMGEVKAIDPPRLTVMRTDHVSQTLELNEETSLRRGRESITMADIQVGDHVIARGAVESNLFVAKNLNLVSPEQWKRMQEMTASGTPNGPAAPNAPATPNAPPSPQNPPEHQN